VVLSTTNIETPHFTMNYTVDSHLEARLNDLNKKIERLNDSFFRIKAWLVVLYVIVGEAIFFALGRNARWL
jgi:hypothetical protein